MIVRGQKVPNYPHLESLEQLQQSNDHNGTAQGTRSLLRCQQVHLGERPVWRQPKYSALVVCCGVCYRGAPVWIVEAAATILAYVKRSRKNNHKIRQKMDCLGQPLDWLLEKGTNTIIIIIIRGHSLHRMVSRRGENLKRAIFCCAAAQTSSGSSVWVHHHRRDYTGRHLNSARQIRAEYDLSI